MNRIGIIGVGYVGACTAFALINNINIDEIYLYDIKKDFLLAQKNDIEQAAMINKKITTVKIAELKDLLNCDIVINTASAKVLSADRLKELDNNKKIIFDIFSQFKGYQGIILNVTNPCDIVSKLIVDASEISPNKVIGTGTLLDSLRLKSTISSLYKVLPSEVEALAMGEHGANLFYAFSQTTIKGKPFFSYLKENNLNYDKELFNKEVMLAGSNIFSVKGRTEYGIANVTNFIVNALLKTIPTAIPLSAKDYYSDKLIYTSRLVLISNKGYLNDIKIVLSDEENAKLADIRAKQYAILYLN